MKFRGHALIAPNLVSRPPGMLMKVGIPFVEITVDCILAVGNGRIIAVVDDRPGHATEHGFNYIQELFSLTLIVARMFNLFYFENTP